MIDLHTHTTCSDGADSPEQLAEEAVACGLTAVAVTDHETTDGTARFAAAAAGRFRAIPGVEISADRPGGGGSVHLLGYFIDINHPEFVDAMARMRRGREERNAEILRKLDELGCRVDPAEVAAAATGGFVGRLHIAQVLEERGFVQDRREAFVRWLKRGRPAYVGRLRFAAEETIRLIRAAGGVAVLAHPYQLGLHIRRLREFVRVLKAAGLCGIEAYYSDHNDVKTRQFLRLAVEEDLAVTGGSDTHGSYKPDIRLGRGFGNLNIPDDLVGLLEARRPS